MAGWLTFLAAAACWAGLASAAASIGSEADAVGRVVEHRGNLMPTMSVTPCGVMVVDAGVGVNKSWLRPTFVPMRGVVLGSNGAVPYQIKWSPGPCRGDPETLRYLAYWESRQPLNPFRAPMEGEAGAAAADIAPVSEAAGASARSPVGRAGAPLSNAPYQPVRNAPGAVGGRQYSGHAFDQMQNRGLTPSVVENTIQNGRAIPGKYPGTTVHYDPVNNVSVVTDTASGRVVTVSPGQFTGGAQ